MKELPNPYIQKPEDKAEGTGLIPFQIGMTQKPPYQTAFHPLHLHLTLGQAALCSEENRTIPGGVVGSDCTPLTDC